MLDFPFCFLAVRVVGTERIGEAEHAIVDGFWSLVGQVMPSMRPENKIVIEADGFSQRESGEIVDVKPHHHKEDASM